ncbi:MAG: hypothetical protein OEY89_01620, partial [Gammaproteobacteria bacterium]|nr:hypothetical protein [Gammaproteobacteria bacterium]
MSNSNLKIAQFKASLQFIGACLIYVIFFLHSIDVTAGDINDPSVIPQVGKPARESYISYLYASEHKAFAIGPGGAWAWQEGFASDEEAESKAIEFCQRYTQQRCVIYAVNNKLVFDQKQWPTLWGPYLSKQ